MSIELPKSMIFEVVSAPPGIRGNSATASSKPVELSNSLIVHAPSFIKKGDKIKIDTQTGEYMERAK